MKRKILIILIITFFTYYKFLFNGFFFEDSHIFRNGYEKTLIKNFYSGYDHTYKEGEFAYRPLIKLIYVLEKIFFKKNIILFHLTSLIIHLINIYLSYLFLKKFEIPERLLFFSILIFALHPVNTEAVIWHSALPDLISFIFLILIIISYLNFYNTQKKFFLIISIILNFLFILTKENNIIIFPIIILLSLYQYFFVKKYNIKKIVLNILPFFILFIGYFLWLYVIFNYLKFSRGEIQGNIILIFIKSFVRKIRMFFLLGYNFNFLNISDKITDILYLFILLICVLLIYKYRKEIPEILLNIRKEILFILITFIILLPNIMVSRKTSGELYSFGFRYLYSSSLFISYLFLKFIRFEKFKKIYVFIFSMLFLIFSIIAINKIITIINSKSVLF